MRVLFGVLLCASPAAAARVCQVPEVPLAQLAGRSPREVRVLLQPIVGVPLVETNQLPDGGTFDKLDAADRQDGVTQRYAWGGDAGSVEIVYQHGLADLVVLRLDEFEQVQGSRVVEACSGWPRDALAQRAGISLPKKPTSVHHAHALSIYRYELAGHTVVRLRCANAEGECMEINTLLGGGEMPRELVKRQPRAATLARRPLR